MNALSQIKNRLNENGFDIIPNLYSENEIQSILKILDLENYPKNLFSIRQLLIQKPELKTHLFNQKIKGLLSELFQDKFFLTKAIFFDKPKEANWFVSYHQDLSISVKEKIKTSGYTNWTFKENQYGVQPPIEILENIITLRIHLDETTKENGALKVIPKSHLKGIVRKDEYDIKTEEEFVCKVDKGGVMLMKPLTLHASNRSINNNKRRVIHLEFSNMVIEKPLEWLEFLRPY